MSNKIFKLAFEDLRITIKSIYVKAFFFLAIVFSVMLFNVKPNETPRYYVESNDMVLIVLIIIAGAFVLGRDFTHNAYTYVFTGVYSKAEIILSKVLTMIQFGIVIWIFQLLLTMVFSIIFIVTNRKVELGSILNFELLNMLVFYVILSALIGSFLILVTSISFNVVTPTFWGISIFMILKIAVYNFTYVIENGLITKPKWAYLIGLLPQGVLTKWHGQFWIKEISILLIYIFINIVVSIIVINKKQLLKKD
ncbi:hypothetical protein psyc5s11_03270 [Clostridium gelidum]|uniref:ABC-2 family transporter protein n=1 Tax=Clostridium gelidum TaxID=704125 RepID=A0ABM7T5L1_9CLOT|nr:hypothetical protein [Clostridium gelidum]BCZ44260.1 hypothetical protein psyc5s11_03270 [Clostridium gelidum]